MNNLNTKYDLIIIGAGPAGLTAAIYACRAGLRTLIMEKESIGGKITSSPKVCNIPGFTEISGVVFGMALYEQAEKAGAELLIEEAISCIPTEAGICINDKYIARSCIIAIGTKNRTLGVPGEQELLGTHIHFCVACDGPFYKDKDVVVIGGGNSAVTEAIELSKMCHSVVLLQNLCCLTAEAALIDELAICNNVAAYCGNRIESFHIDTATNKVLINIDTPGCDTDSVVCDGVFEAVGMEPQNELFPYEKFPEVVTEYNYFDVQSGGNVSGLPGLFAAGDCTTSPLRQVVTACAEGAQAATSAINYIRKIRKHE